MVHRLYICILLYATGNMYKHIQCTIFNSKNSKCPDLLTCVIFIHNKNKLHFMQEHVRISETYG